MNDPVLPPLERVPPITMYFPVQGYAEPQPLLVDWFGALHTDDRIACWNAATDDKTGVFPTHVNIPLLEATPQEALREIKRRGYQYQIELAEIGFGDYPKQPPVELGAEAFARPDPLSSRTTTTVFPETP